MQPLDGLVIKDTASFSANIEIRLYAIAIVFA